MTGSETGCPMCEPDDECPGQHNLVELADVVAMLDERIKGYRYVAACGEMIDPDVSTMAKLRADECADVRASLVEKYEWPPKASVPTGSNE